MNEISSHVRWSVQPEVDTPRSGAVAVVALRVAVMGLALLAGGSALVERSWLGGRTVWIVVVAGVVGLVVRNMPSSGSRLDGVVAALLAAIGAVVGATGLGRAGGGVASRVFARDLPPPAVYSIPVVFVLLAVGCAVLAVAWRSTVTSARVKDLRRGLGAGLIAVAVLVPAMLSVGWVARWLDDRLVESDALVHTVSRPAERVSDEAGPANPTAEVWELELLERRVDDLSLPEVASMTAIPGWDAILVNESDSIAGLGTSRVIAVSAIDGSELWRYERHGAFDAVTADPESGRVLLVNGDAAIVVALDDGRELATTQLPGGLFCVDSVGDRFNSGPWDVTVGSAAVMICGADKSLRLVDQTHIVAMIEVASGTVLATTDSPGDAYECMYAALTVTESPVLARWGQGLYNDDCGRPVVLAPNGTGAIEPIAEIPPPPGTGKGCRDDCGPFGLVAAGDTVLVTLEWWELGSTDRDASGPLVDLVALSTEGELRWRVTGSQDVGTPVAVTDRGVVVRGGEMWRLLSLTDGSELLRRQGVGDDTDIYGSYAVSDGEHIYTVDTEIGLVVRRADDLSPVGTWPVVPEKEYSRDAFVAAGLLVVPLADLDGNFGLVAYGDGASPLDEP
jgi:hypothetical protein